MSRIAIGLIGGIAMGKSLAAEHFKALGIEVIDTDHIARALVAKGEPLLTQIQEHFGPALLSPTGELKRDMLRALIFKDPAAKSWLEALLHPAIRQRAKEAVAASASPYCLVAIPLLKAREDYPFLQRVLSIEAPEALQTQRLMARDHIAATLAATMIATQPSRAMRAALADDIIHNENTPEALAAQVLAYHRKYLALTKGDA